LSEPLDPDLLDRRLGAASELVPALGPPARTRRIERAELAEVRCAFADAPYADGGPAIRVAVANDVGAALLLAGHHGALDGLGLVALLGAALAAPVTSSVRGIGPDPAVPWRPLAIAARLREAVFAPPARVVPARRDVASLGDRLVAAPAAGLAGGTATLAAAGMRAVRRWNQAHGRTTRRPVVAIGASRRGGAPPVLTHEAAWLRLAPTADDDASVRIALERALPERVGGGPRLPRPLGAPARRAAEQLGSTLLVSNVGVLHGPDQLLSVAFFPKAYGRSAVALGGATVAGTSTVSLRVRARDFAEDEAQQLLAEVIRQLPVAPASGPAPTTTATGG
jgi:hypothetical protein